jgi:uncharacterized protein YhaN
MHVRCGAVELSQLLEQIAAKTRELNEVIVGHGVGVGELPDGFDRLEERRIRGESSQRAVQEAKGRVRQLEGDLGGVSQLRKQFAAAQKQLTAAQTNLDALKMLVPAGLDAEQLAAEIDRLREQIKSHEQEADAARLAVDRATERHSVLESDSAKQAEALSHFKTRLRELNERLNGLLADGLTDDERTREIGELRVKLAGAQHDRQEAEAAVNALGPAVTDNELQALERNLNELEKQINDSQYRLAEDRSAVRTLCGADPQGESDRLKDELRELEPQLVQEERKLGALVLLHAVLGQEQRKLTQLLADPLNQQISPWLRQIRGVTTRVLFDPEGQRITKVVTDYGTHRDELPFEELSEGTKGEISLLVRLTLAREIARRNNGRNFVILDDPLTETSPDRRPEMFRVLQQAAQDLQIVFVTCHADVLATLPGQPHVVELTEPTQNGPVVNVTADGSVG